MIRVNDDWVIMVDQYNYTPMRDLRRKKTVVQDDGTEKTEQVYGRPVGYYTTLKEAVKAVARAEYKRGLHGRETPLSEAIKIMQETVDRFEKILEGIKE